MVFLDWLSIYQDHEAGTLPRVGSELVCYLDLDGELKRELVKGYQHPGSWDTSLRVRCDGTRVEVSGNPSKYGRLDNLFGFLDVRAAVGVYNRVLAELGLPPFTAMDAPGKARDRQHSRDDGVAYRGARITAVHITKNLAVGRGCERDYLRWASTIVHHGESGKLYPDGNTTTWGEGSERVMIEYYNKANELRRHRVERTSTEGHRYCPLEEDEGYRGRLVDWCESQGIVRHEVKLKSKQLVREGLERIEGWTMERMQEISSKYHIAGRAKGGVGRGSYMDIASELMAMGIKKNDAQRAQQAALSWMAGYDLRPPVLSKSSYYRLRNMLRNVGMDIGAPCNVTALPVRVREVEVRPLAVDDAPSWYKRCA